MLTWGPTLFENAFSLLLFLKVIFSFILHPLILRKSMCYGSRRGPLPNNTSCHLIAKLRIVIIILGGPTGQSAPVYSNEVLINFQYEAASRIVVFSIIILRDTHSKFHLIHVNSRKLGPKDPRTFARVEIICYSLLMKIGIHKVY